jgi:membrane protease YdiL (CAAX protease family)
VNKVFVGPYGLRAGWRAVLFLLLAVIFTSAAGPLPRLGLAGILDRDGERLFQTVFSALAIFAATWVMSRMDRQPVTAYGLGTVNRWRNLFSGMAAAFLVLSALMATLRISGAYDFSAGDIAGGMIWKWAGYWMLFFAAVGLMEELVTRGYPLFAMAQGMGFWPSAVLLSLVFGLGHLGNHGEAITGILNAVIAGLVFAFSLRWTGTLWWAIGAHMSWDWGESFFYGVADSGILTSHHYLTGTPSGPAWLSGGSVGPEGSVFAAGALLLLGVVVRFTSPKYAEPGLERRQSPPPSVSVPGEIPPPALPPSASPSTYSVDSGDTN